jgi:SAM-dependent methyltransferase
MSGWGSGYVTDITYMTGYYRYQAPSLLSLACLLGNVAAPLPGPDDEVSYLELGCGQGFGALLLAASNPRWKVTAIDFHPAHIATAREWAAKAQLDNIRFLEADLSTLAEDAASAAIPEADYVSFHGVWSWVPAPVQAGIVRLLRQKVKPGGIVHLSYNALPAWGPALGLQRLLREGGQRLHAGRSDQQAVEGLKLVQELRGADAYQLVRSLWLKNLIERTEQLPTQYLAHEYMNEAWAPCFHADVVNAMTGAKLEWVASANLAENFPELTFSPEQRAIARRINDPVLRELIKDMCLNRSLRHDVFVRGARRISPAMRDAALRDVWLSSSIAPSELPAEVEMPVGNAELSPGFYRPIANALASGPRQVGDLLSLPDLEGKRDNAAELIGVMVGLHMAEAALRPGAGPIAHASRFNRLITSELSRTENPGKGLAAASHLLGGGAPCSLFDLYVLERVQAGEGEANLDDWVRQIGGNMEGEERARLRDVLTRCLQVRVPVMLAQGVT